MTAIACCLAPGALHAQSPRRTPRIGFVLTTAPLSTMQGPEPSETVMRGFLKGLQEFGYVDGRDIVIERRTAEGNPERLPGLIRGLVEARVEVIVVTGNTMAQQAMQVTSTVPLVAAGMSETVALGFAKNLAKPAGNLTGLVPVVTGSKRLEILNEIVPDARRIAYLAERESWDSEDGDALRAAAGKLGLTFYLAEVRMPDLEAAFDALARHRPDALFVSADPPFFVHRERIAAFASKIRVPDLHYYYQAVEAGGLASYGHDSFDIFRRSARYVDRILKGAQPRELAIERLERYTLAVNMKTARALTLKIPQLTLVRADRVIE